ncbi:MAG: response regulator [Rubrivivax sp.]|nr:response regulator [Pyrinomonadaceae bacterium]
MKRTILYLDDEAACLQIFLDLLGEHYEVQTARTLAEARALLAARPAEVVISDQLMPDIEGTEFLREVAEKYPASRRVLLTGTVTLGNVIQQVGNGVVQFFLMKPWTEQEMQAVLERAGAYLEPSARSRTVSSW